MGKFIIFGLIAVVVGMAFFSDETEYADDNIDLNLVLDVTVDTLHAFSEELDKQTSPNEDAAFIELADRLGVDYNTSQPPIYPSTIAVSPQTDSSLLAFNDINANNALDDGEALLFRIEIDGEQARIIASDQNGAVNDHSFSGSGLLMGFLIGSMLSRQTRAGVNPKSLANKKPTTASAAAKSRAGSGSHSSGK